MREFLAALEYVRRRRRLEAPRWTLARAAAELGADYEEVRRIAGLLERLPDGMLGCWGETAEEFVGRSLRRVGGKTEEEAREKFELLKGIAAALGVERDWAADWERVRERCGKVGLIPFAELVELYGLKHSREQ